MKNEKSNFTNDEIDYKHLEKVFTNNIHYMAMKELPLSEKFAIYVYVFREEYLDRLCKDYQISKKGFIQIKNNGINRFRKNVRKYNSKPYKKKNYHKKGGV